MKAILLSYMLASTALFAASIRQQSTVNERSYTADVTTEFLSKHSSFPKDLSHVENLEKIERVALDYINKNFNANIDPAKVSGTHRSIEFRTLSEGESTYYYVVYFIAVQVGDNVFDYYRIPLAPDHTVIAPVLFNEKS